MKNDCGKYKESLLEAALAGNAESELDAHLKSCPGCAEELSELRARRAQLDAFLPLLAREAEPSPGFRAQVLAATEAADKNSGRRLWGVWVLAGAAIVAALAAGWTIEQRKLRLGVEKEAAAQNEIAGAQKLAEWRAPSDVLLETPGNELLRTTPKLGQSYLKDGAKTNQEE